MEPQGLAPHSQTHATCPYPELAPTMCTKFKKFRACILEGGNSFTFQKLTRCSYGFAVSPFFRKIKTTALRVVILEFHIRITGNR